MAAAMAMAVTVVYIIYMCAQSRTEERGYWRGVASRNDNTRSSETIKISSLPVLLPGTSAFGYTGAGALYPALPAYAA